MVIDVNTVNLNSLVTFPDEGGFGRPLSEAFNGVVVKTKSVPGLHDPKNGGEAFDTLQHEVDRFYTSMVRERITSLSTEKRADFAKKPVYGTIKDDIFDTLTDFSDDFLPEGKAKEAVKKLSATLAVLKFALENQTGKEKDIKLFSEIKDRFVKDHKMSEDDALVAAMNVTEAVKAINKYAIQISTAPQPKPQPAPTQTPPKPKPNNNPPQPQPIKNNFGGSDTDDSNPDNTNQTMPIGFFEPLENFYSQMQIQGVAISHKWAGRMAVLTRMYPGLTQIMAEKLQHGGQLNDVTETDITHLLLMTTAIDRANEFATHNKQMPFQVGVLHPQGGKPYGMPDNDADVQKRMRDLDKDEVYKSSPTLRFALPQSHTDFNGQEYTTVITKAGLTSAQQIEQMTYQGVLILEQLKAAGHPTGTFRGQCTPEFVHGMIEASRHVDGIDIDMSTLKNAGLTAEQFDSAMRHMQDVKNDQSNPAQDKKNAFGKSKPIPQPQPKPEDKNPKLVDLKTDKAAAAAEAKRLKDEQEAKKLADERKSEKSKSKSSTDWAGWVRNALLAGVIAAAGYLALNPELVADWKKRAGFNDGNSGKNKIENTNDKSIGDQIEDNLDNAAKTLNELISPAEKKAKKAHHGLVRTRHDRNPAVVITDTTTTKPVVVAPTPDTPTPLAYDEHAPQLEFATPNQQGNDVNPIPVGHHTLFLRNVGGDMRVYDENGQEMTKKNMRVIILEVKAEHDPRFEKEDLAMAKELKGLASRRVHPN